MLHDGSLSSLRKGLWLTCKQGAACQPRALGSWHLPSLWIGNKPVWRSQCLTSAKGRAAHRGSGKAGRGCSGEGLRGSLGAGLERGDRDWRLGRQRSSLGVLLDAGSAAQLRRGQRLPGGRRLPGNDLCNVPTPTPFETCLECGQSCLQAFPSAEQLQGMAPASALLSARRHAAKPMACRAMRASNDSSHGQAP